MSYLGYLSLEGKSQGLISAGCSSLDSIGNRYQAAHSNEIQVFSLSNIISREQNVHHHAFEFLKPVDKSTPLLAQALDKAELLKATFKLYRTNQQGSIEHFFNIVLTDAVLQEFGLHTPHTLNEAGTMPFERILLRYKSISWEHKLSNTSAYSFWEDRVS
ncbi:Hcp family type VI secretion system effector [Serratia microhaemolytica]|uniref:Hcp family type VI secretion system effector n=1 Tax=Serratia microhaemolytica TaxID=2675110 RepID=UPI000FDE0889|nr:Hcp family type VI secretion system effector [Serratia microhaemolytica]